jgi:hypothetical protein
MYRAHASRVRCGVPSGVGLCVVCVECVSVCSFVRDQRFRTPGHVALITAHCARSGAHTHIAAPTAATAAAASLHTSPRPVGTPPSTLVSRDSRTLPWAQLCPFTRRRRRSARCARAAPVRTCPSPVRLTLGRCDLLTLCASSRGCVQTAVGLRGAPPFPIPSSSPVLALGGTVL